MKQGRVSRVAGGKRLVAVLASALNLMFFKLVRVAHPKKRERSDRKDPFTLKE